MRITEGNARILAAAGAAGAVLMLTGTPAWAQNAGGQPTASISAVPGVSSTQSPAAGSVPGGVQPTVSSSAGAASTPSSVQLGPVQGLGGGIRPVRMLPPVGAPLSLDDAIRVSLANNLNIFTASSQETKAQDRVNETTKNFLPRFGVSANFTYTGDVQEVTLSPGTPPIVLGSHEQYVASAAVTQPIDTSGSLAATKSIAEAQRDAQYWALDSARRQVILSTASAYLNLMRNQSTMDVARQQLADAQARVDIAQKNLAQGTIARYDLLVEQTSLANAQTQLFSAQRAVNDSMADLNNAMGISQETTLTLAALAPPDNTLPEFRPSLAAAMINRPELHQIDANVAAALQSVRLAKSDLIPSLGLQAAYNYTGVTSAFAGLHNQWTFAVVGSWTPFDFGATQDRAAQAREDARTNGYLKQQTEQGIEYQVRQSLNQISDALGRRTAALASVTQAQEQLRLATVRFQAGTGTRTDELDAETVLAQSETNASNALYDYYAAIADYQRATGTEPLAAGPVPVSAPGDVNPNPATTGNNPNPVPAGTNANPGPTGAAVPAPPRH